MRYRMFTIAATLTLALTGVAAAQQGVNKRIAKPHIEPAATQNAQPAGNPAPNVQPSASPTSGTATIEFAEEPLRLPSVGLAILCPVGAASQIDSAGRDSAITMLAADTSWSVKVKTPRFTDLAMTPMQVADLALQNLFEAYGIGFKSASEAAAAGKLIREPLPGQTLTVAGHDCVRWYLTLPSLEGKVSTLRGYAVIRPSPGQFVVFELLTTQPKANEVIPYFQTMIATTTLEDASKLSAERSAAVAAGMKMIEALGTQAYKDIAAAHPERWERRYVPGVSGSDSEAKEIAYRRIRFSYGQRGVLDGTKGANSKASGNRSEGFIVQIDARMLAPDGSVTDTRSQYFMTPDRNEETWTVSNAFRIKPGAEPIVASETGARNQQSLVIQTESKGTAPDTYKPIWQGDGYLNQVELYMLPLLVMKAGMEVDLGFFAWNVNERKVVLRRDLLTSITTDNGEKHWKITSRPVEGRAPQEAYYTEDGSLLRIEMPDHSVWEPTTYPELRKIWESKGLPTK
jgi:hypothetical protein